MQADEQLPVAGIPAITAYGAGFIEIDGKTFRQPVLIDRGSVVVLAENTAMPSAEDFQAAAQNGARIALIGTGARAIFPHPRDAAAAAQVGLGIECMNTAAACRTYAVLTAEGRPVWAWLMPPEQDQ